MNGRGRGKERRGKGSGVFDSATFHLAAPINRRSRCDGSQPRIDPARDRITERERREASRSSIGSVFSPSPRRRIISPPLPRDKLPRGAAPSLLFPPPSLLPPSFSLFPLLHPRPTDRATDQYDTASADTVGPLLLQITTEREEERERKGEGEREEEGKLPYKPLFK